MDDLAKRMIDMHIKMCLHEAFKNNEEMPDHVIDEKNKTATFYVEKNKHNIDKIKSGWYACCKTLDEEKEWKLIPKVWGFDDMFKSYVNDNVDKNLPRLGW